MTDPTHGENGASDPGEKPRLDYRDVRADLPEKPLAIAPGILTGIVVAILTMGLVAFWIMFGFGFFQGPSSEPATGVLVLAGITLVVTAICATLLYRNRRSRQIIMGALIGLGVAMLIEGTCFAITVRR